MAFLVCYSDSLADHLDDKAIYLDQEFYELIFRRYRGKSSGFALLGQIAMLRYKSSTILISTDKLSALSNELDTLEDSKHEHPQIREFKTVCQHAKQKGTSLTISGDMSPELDD